MVKSGYEDQLGTRSTEGDAAADALLAELEAALARIAAEDALASLTAVFEGLAQEIAATKHAIDNGGDERDALVALLAAAESVIRWAEE